MRKCAKKAFEEDAGTMVRACFLILNENSLRYGEQQQQQRGRELTLRVRLRARADVNRKGPNFLLY
jgi:alkyl hydroperoxide reductase subunit AhpC